MSTTAAKTNETVKSRMSTRDIVLIGMFAALLAAFSQISCPCPPACPSPFRPSAWLWSAWYWVGSGPCSPPSFTYCQGVGLGVRQFQGGLRVITGLTGVIFLPGR